GLLVGAATAHLDHRAGAGGRGHPGGGGGDRGVVVEDREHERLEHDAVGEVGLDDEHGGVGEVALALRVPPDVALEAVLGEEVESGLVDDPTIPQVTQLRIAEAEVLDRVEEPPGAGEHAVTPAVWQAPGEGLEDAALPGRAAVQGGLDHRQLVLVGQECRAGSVHHASHSMVGGVSIAPTEQQSIEPDAIEAVDVPWITLVWNDPVNLMSYVTWVFMTHFGYPEQQAEKLMMDVHLKGRAVVAHG